MTTATELCCGVSLESCELLARVKSNAEGWCNMSDCCGPRHEEDGISQVICYLLGAFTIGMCLALLIIVERLR